MGGLMSKSQSQAPATAGAAASDKPDEQNEQKAEVAEQASPQQAAEGNEGDAKQHQEETFKEVESAAPAAAGQSVVAEPTVSSSPSAEPRHQPDENEPEVVETPQVVEESPLPVEPIKVDESVSETGEAAATKQAPEAALSGEGVPDGEVSSPKPEVRNPVGDVDTLVDDVTKLKIVPDEAPAESGNNQELVSSVTNELRQETDSSTPLPTVSDGDYVEHTADVPMDNACRLIENEAA